MRETRHPTVLLPVDCPPPARLLAAPCSSIPVECCSAVIMVSIDETRSPGSPGVCASLGTLSGCLVLLQVRLQLRVVPKSHLHFEERPHPFNP